MNKSPDKITIQKIKNGEIDAFSAIVNAYTRPILAYVNRTIFDKTEVEDLVQNTFVQFYKHLDSFDVERPILPYLYQIAKNEMRMYFRSYQKNISLDEKINSATTIPQEDFSDIEEIINTLPPDQKKAIQLLYEGHSYAEVASILKKPLNTVRTVIRRARLTLKKEYYEKT